MFTTRIRDFIFSTQNNNNDKIINFIKQRVHKLYSIYIYSISFNCPYVVTRNILYSNIILCLLDICFYTCSFQFDVIAILFTLKNINSYPKVFDCQTFVNKIFTYLISLSLSVFTDVSGTYFFQK